MGAAQSIDDRFWSKVLKTQSGCWVWTASRWGRKRLYGKFSPRHGLSVDAHRFAYRLLRGAVPDGLQLDHLCRNPPCVNPDHLEPVTSRVNLLRGNTAARWKSEQVVCIRGHELGIRKQKNGSRRYCPTCQRDRLRRRYA